MLINVAVVQLKRNAPLVLMVTVTDEQGSLQTQLFITPDEGQALATALKNSAETAKHKLMLADAVPPMAPGKA